MTRVEIDLNVRCGRWQTYSGFEDITGEFPAVGDVVEVFESESGIHGTGTVLELREETETVVLQVFWSDLVLE